MLIATPLCVHKHTRRKRGASTSTIPNNSMERKMLFEIKFSQTSVPTHSHPLLDGV